MQFKKRRLKAVVPFRLLTIIFVCAIFNVLSVKGSSKTSFKIEKHAEFGTDIQLPCILKLPQCTDVHSVKWYKGNKRIFLYSTEGDIMLPSHKVALRMSMILPRNNTRISYLKISNLTLDDESLYKCEVTYLLVTHECNNVQHIALNVTVQPTSVRVIDESTKQTLEDGRVLGPIIEGSTIDLRCESGKGKPIPTVEWYNGNVRLTSESSAELEEHEIGTGSGTLNFVVSRNELGATFTCKVNNLALTEPLKIDIKLNVHVRPIKMDIKGVIGHVIQGSKVLLQCEVQAARPPANVTWYNGTKILEKSNSRLDMYETKFADNEDGTTQTNSFLAFTATEHDNGQKFSCLAMNSVMLKEGSKPMKETVIIEVMYRPVVRMNPPNITVNETKDFQLFCDYEANPATLINVIWQRDRKNLNLNENRFEGGTIELTSLLVKNAKSSDIGKYRCILENDLGTSSSQDFIDVSVLFRPIMKVIIEPHVPINEAARVNISLSCNLITGNPKSLKAVRWYFEGNLLKKLPNCSRNVFAKKLCNIKPNKLLLESVGRSFHGNFSCEGRNDAGWGPISSNTTLIVHYKPGPASISYQPVKVIKKGQLNITCSVKDLGRPKAIYFKWFRGVLRLSEEYQSIYRVKNARLENVENFTCLAYNEVGDGDSATTFVNIEAPPAFIQKLPQFAGFVYNATSVSLNCHVECSPLCNITWMKNNKTIDFTSMQQYFVQNNRVPSNVLTDDFESMNSSLVWNLSAWPSGQLDRVTDNDITFTCISTSNDVGPGVMSTVNIQVYFPPENMTISKKVVNVVVDNIPESITCNAIARPDPQYRWYRKESEIISEDAVLYFKTPFSRNSHGIYICQANNNIGSQTISTYINVQYKPECQVVKETISGKDYVICSADGNPTDYNFDWSLKSDNDTIKQLSTIINGKSYLPLDDSILIPRTYVCIANNSIGQSNSCERHVPANFPWWLKIDGDLLATIIALAVIIILIIIIVCVVIFLMCRRKHRQLKQPSQRVKRSPTESVSEGLSEPETKTFYENLPFHGIQSPPNKLLSSMFDRVAYPSTLHDYTNALHSSVTTASSLSPCSSRPISRATSLCDGVGSSSGYESSIMRSHLGPHYSDHNMPRTNSPEPKYKSFKSRRRKYHQYHHQHNTQFYSLRLCRKHFQCHNRSKPDNKLQMTRSYQLYAIPIYRTCPHKSTSNSTIATSLRSNESTLISTLLRSAKNNRENNDEVPNQQQEGEQENEEAYKIPPIPAPRTTRKTDPSEHTYQNVPSPVFPQSLPSDSKQKPFKPKFSDLDYADVDYRSYGPINYKAASIALLQNHKKLQQQHLEQDECNPQMYCVSNDSEELL